MDADERECLNGLSQAIIGAAFEVSNVLGVGFLEKVYERALCVELSSRGLSVEPQAILDVIYKGANVGEYYADLLVERRIIVELKYVEAIAKEHVAQCINYLKATGLHLALLLNFGHPKLQYKRIVRDF